MTDKRNPGPVAAGDPGRSHYPLTAIQHSDVPGDCKCPTCGQALPFSSFDWLENLELLLARYAGELGITADLASLTIIEAWWLFHWLVGMNQ